ncbi:hypothetical protein DBV15_11508 [Temnothorax longispinosus]|uniref:Uncharacterized protein n=1 Tax=Temnothorax longispinosus TaxID=300112 RepID=A0A4S2KRG1_9HYME|nr:hypothetical protein DBV15_11508 [Temnothorax longispinosus]
MRGVSASCTSTEGPREHPGTPPHSDINRTTSAHISAPLSQFESFASQHVSEDSNSHITIPHPRASAPNLLKLRNQLLNNKEDNPRDNLLPMDEDDSDEYMDTSPTSDKTAPLSPIITNPKDNFPPSPPQATTVKECRHLGLGNAQRLRLISQFAYKDVIEVRKTGRGRVTVDFRSREAANNLADNPILKAANLKAYIPSFKVQRIGIIKDVPKKFPTDSLTDYIESSAKIQDLATSAINARDVHDVCSVAKTSMTRTKSTPIRTTPPKCINCDRLHRATSTECPIILQQKQINALAAAENISYIEARRKVKGAKLPGDPRLDFVNFPNMSTPSPTSNTPIRSDYTPPLQNRFNPLAEEEFSHSSQDFSGNPYIC